MVKNKIKYVLACMGLYLTMSSVEIFMLRPLVDFIGEGFWIHFAVYTVLLLLVNPLLAKLIADKLDIYSKFNNQL